MMMICAHFRMMKTYINVILVLYTILFGICTYKKIKSRTRCFFFLIKLLKKPHACIIIIIIKKICNKQSLCVHIYEKKKFISLLFKLNYIVYIRMSILYCIRFNVIRVYNYDDNIL